jgi:hypothetical protein
MSVSGGPKVVDSGLVLYLDAANSKSYTGSGTAWTDLSGNGNDGNLINGPTFIESNLGSIEFDGVNDWISTSHQLVSGTDASVPITLSFWINPSSLQSSVSNNPILIGSAYYSGFGLQYTGSVYRIWLRISSGTYVDNLPFVLDEYQHVTLIWGGISDSRIYSYINGYQNSNRSVTYSEFNQNLTTRPFRIGRAYTTGGSSASGFLTGKISNVQIYNRALSAEEVLQNYNATKSRYGL